MIFKFWDTIFDYFKEKPYWSKIRPFFTLISLYLITIILSYQFIQWQYRISPSLPLYLHSYIFKQITLVFIGICIIFFFFNRRKSQEGEGQNTVGKIIRKYTPIVIHKVIILSLVLVIIIPIYLYLSPNNVSHIRIKFLQEPDFDKYAFVYLIYELNKLQKNWFFEIDFDTFDENVFTSKEREKCARSKAKSLCYAETIANDTPFIGITTEKLGEDWFWQNYHTISVISTFEWNQYAPPNVYEFLTYSTIVQSILIHLNAHCTGLPEKAFTASRVSYGDLFQFSPRRRAMKATILASHLNRRGEELLFNCFGVEYMSICSNLLTLEWLHSKKITENLEKSFGVKF